MVCALRDGDYAVLDVVDGGHDDDVRDVYDDFAVVYGVTDVVCGAVVARMFVLLVMMLMMLASMMRCARLRG